MIGTQQVVWLHFLAISNQSSVIVPLLLDNIAGVQPGGLEVRNFAPQAGCIVIVGEGPILEAFFKMNHQPALMLYAKTGTTNVVIGSPDLSAPAAAWTSEQSGGLSDLFQRIQPPATSQWMFNRAKRVP